MISFSCSHCGIKLKVKNQFAGRKAPCPTCKQALVVPAVEATQAYVPPGAMDGTPSSLHQTGVLADVTLEGLDANAKPGQKPVQELLGQRKKGQRYVLGGEIARGGMGAVLRAVDCDIRREVAVKYLLNNADPKAKARFLEEAQITGQLEHPNIPPVHEVGVDSQGRMFMAMKMVKGHSLAQALDELRNNPRSAEKDWPLTRLVNVLVSMCNALAYAHSRGVIHRDLKPANVMIGDFGEVYVMDWGLAKVLKSRDREGAVEPAALPDGRGSSRSSKVVVSREPDIDITQQGSVLGTPVYMPPEQATGKISEIDQRSDIYSLGAVLYEILTLQPPVEKDGGYLAVLMNVAEGKIVPPEQRIQSSTTRKQVPPKELSAIAMKALAKEQKNRYQSMEALRKDLERFQEGRSVSAKADTTREILWKLVKRNKAVSAALFVLLPVLLVLFGSNFLNSRARAREQAEKEKRTTKAVPALVLAARTVANEGRFPEALDQIGVVLDYDPGNAAARLLRGQIRIGQKDWSAARTELAEYLRHRPRDLDAEELLERCRRNNREDPVNLLALAEILQRQRAFGPAAPLLAAVERAVKARQLLVAPYQKQIDAAWPGLGGRLSMNAAGQFQLNFDRQKQVVSLEPLKGMALGVLRLVGCDRIQDLSPLKGMPLTLLDLHGCGQVRDLSPLKGMPLTSLNLNYCALVRDLAPLKGMPLTALSAYECRAVRDLSPLKGMPLKSLSLNNCFLVGDLSPLKGMPLTELSIINCALVRDLAPLKGMKLTSLDLGGCSGVRDLSPLKGMPLTSLSLRACGQVRDLSPLEGMKLSSIWLPLQVDKGMDVLRRMKDLGRILVGNNDLPPADFWKQYDAGKYPQYKD